MLTSLAHTAVCVPDVEEAVRWYESVLGLTVIWSPILMENDDIEKDMGELIPAPVAGKGEGRGHGADRSRLEPRRARVRRSRGRPRRSRGQGRAVPHRRPGRHRRSAHHLVRGPLAQRLYPDGEEAPQEAVLQPVLKS